MGTPPAVYLTEVLARQQLRQAIEAFPAFVKRHFSDCIILAEYGWGSNLHPQLCYREMQVGVGWLDRFVADSLRQEIVNPGDSDFLISLPDNQLIILFCHEGDIHTHGTDLAIQTALWNHDPFKTFPLRRSPHSPC